jgi:MHS family citrate/tricarballylate:H+ symporter-like MFS transporter
MTTSAKEKLSMAEAPLTKRIKAVCRVTSGHFLEMFDFILFGFYATYIAGTFFPSDNEYASLMLTLLTFGAGFLMRPLGAVILGAYVDRVGRRKGLIVTLSLMAAATLIIAFTPGYRTIGAFAPLLILVGRLLQGFSAGAELGSVAVYLAEMAPAGHKGFYVSWQSVAQQAGVVLAALLGYGMNKWFTTAEIAAWAWRIPFVIGCTLIPFLFVIRRSLEETEEFLARKERPTLKQIYLSLSRNIGVVLAGMLMVAMTTVSFYLLTVYTPTFGISVLHLSATDSLLVALAVGLCNAVWLPISGALSDRIGRWPVLITFTVVTILSAYPAMSWLVAAPSFFRMLIVLLWLATMYGGYNGTLYIALAEVMPVEVRAAGFSLAFAIATALFGGFTPAAATWLVRALDDRAAPALWISGGAACGLAGCLIFIFLGAGRRGRLADKPREIEFV